MVKDVATTEEKLSMTVVVDRWSHFLLSFIR